MYKQGPTGHKKHDLSCSGREVPLQGWGEQPRSPWSGSRRVFRPSGAGGSRLRVKAQFFILIAKCGQLTKHMKTICD